MSLQEYINLPLEVQDPHRVVVSRKVIDFILQPNIFAK